MSSTAAIAVATNVPTSKNKYRGFKSIIAFIVFLIILGAVVGIIILLGNQLSLQ